MDVSRDGNFVLMRDVVIGGAAVLLSSPAAVVLCPPDAAVGRILVLAVAGGVTAAGLADWHAVAMMTAAAAFVFAYVLEGGADAATAWSYNPVLLLAAVVARGYRTLRTAEDRG